MFHVAKLDKKMETTKDFSKKMLFFCRDTLRLFVVDALLAGLAAMFAYVTARVYHSSNCPTHGLSRILAFILKADGQKDNISFSF